MLRAAADNGLQVSFGTPFPEAAAWTRYYAGWADKIIGEVTAAPSRTAGTLR